MLHREVKDWITAKYKDQKLKKTAEDLALEPIDDSQLDKDETALNSSKGSVEKPRFSKKLVKKRRSTSLTSLKKSFAAQAQKLQLEGSFQQEEVAPTDENIQNAAHKQQKKQGEPSHPLE